MRDEWLLLLWRHRGKIIGALLGLFTGWFIVRYGVLQFLLVLAFVAAGTWIGAYADGDDPRRDWSSWGRWLRR